MEWKDLKRVNEGLKGIDVKGKDYVEVHKRVMAFRELEPNGTITTEIIDNTGGVVLMKTTVADGDGVILATGYAYEKESSSFINKTSYIENCETSAVGRALGFCGIGVDASIASAEEVQNAIQQQEDAQKKQEPLASTAEKKVFYDRCEQLGVNYKTIAKQAGATSMASMTKEQQGRALIILKEIEEEKQAQIDAAQEMLINGDL